MTDWPATFARLDRISRERALTDAESRMLERAIDKMEQPAAPVPENGWTHEQVGRFCELIADGRAIREAGREVGKTAGAAVAKFKRIRDAMGAQAA